MTDRNNAGEFNRRAFLVRASQVACALSFASPALSKFLDSAAYASSATRVTGRVASTDLSAIASGLQWRMLGPFRGGRVAAATGVPGRPNEFYFGAVNGGVWKSIDAGRIWFPIFDSQPVASIGAIAVAPSAPDVVYVGSGESTLRDSVGFGNGMYKSVDAGKTWSHIGLADTQHIGKIAIDPKNPNVLFVAAIGHLYAPNAERGVFRSTDGGKNWQKVLYKNEDVGAVEVVIDPNNSRVVYAGLWNTRRPPWFTYRPTNGPGGGIYKSVDGGTTWKQLTNGLPPAEIGRTGIAVSASNSKRVYAVVDCLAADPTAPQPPAPTNGRPAQDPPGQGGFFRSDDAGATWTRMSSDQALWGRGWYFEKLAVDPKNADIVYVPNVAVSRTKDGGKTWQALRGSPGGDDYHQAWVSPNDSNTMIVASDQGAIITHNATADDPKSVTWSSWLNQPTAQLYHISVDYRSPYWVTGAQQDSGAVAVRSRGKFAEISMRDWEPIAPGGESGYTAGDPLNPGIVFGSSGERYNLETNTPVKGTTAPNAPEPARADWTQPLVLSHADPHALYYANQFLFKTTDAAKTWSQVSPDLTRADAGAPSTLDATAAAHVDRNGKRGVIYTIAPSPLRAPLLWIGTDDGLIQLTTDDGKNWQNVTPQMMTPWSRVTMMDASHFDENAAYASVDRHQLQDFDPYIYRTRDMGKSWQKITNGLPAGVYVHCVKEDRKRKGMLVCGTERGVYLSLDDGDNWQPLRLNLPVTSMRDFEFHDDDLIVGTHGRGIWVIDDISALRQLSDAVLNEDAHLFKPADAQQFAQGDDNGTPLQKDEPQAQNRPAGAFIDYYLKAASSAPVTLEILDASGKVVQTFTSDPATPPAQGRRRGGGRPTGGIASVSPLWVSPPERFSAAAGLHRAVWNPVMQSASAP
ncbi:MAG: glycoside hydrolase, partial [bacterium]